MGLFKIRKKNDKIIDLGEKYRKQQEKIKNIQEDLQKTNIKNNPQETSQGIFPFFSNTSQINTEEKNDSLSNDSQEKRKKLAKRLIDMTDKIEDLSNQIYHLQQRVEILERRNQGSGY